MESGIANRTHPMGEPPWAVGQASDMKILKVIAGMLLCLFLGGYCIAGELPSAPPPGGDFTLESLKGSVSTRQFRGKVVMLYFGYTQCPDICPTSLSAMTQALNELDEAELNKVVGVFVSVDPERDTPASLAGYVGYFHPSFIGVTGAPEAVDAAARLYGVQYTLTREEGSALEYTVDHSAIVYLIDPSGVLRFAFPHGTSAETLLGAIRLLLENP